MDAQFESSPLGRDWFDRLRAKFEGGQDSALLEAVYWCALLEIEMPDWVSQNFIQHFQRAVKLEMRSWDGVFGTPVPKGAHLKRLRRDRKLRSAVWARIRRIRWTEKEFAVDEALFERVGKEFKIGKTKCSELYYGVKATFSKSPAAKS